MPASMNQQLDQTYPLCRSLAGREAWEAVVSALAEAGDEPDLEAYLRSGHGPDGLPPFMADLAWLEKSRALAAEAPEPGPVKQYEVNPALYLKQVEWLGLEDLTGGSRGDPAPRPGNGWLMVWRDPAGGEVKAEEAGDQDLLALKMVVEDLDLRRLAEEMGAKPSELRRVRAAAVERGVLLAPPSALVRVAPQSEQQPPASREFLATDVFTLQWHLTQQCDLDCKHCYDRSDRSPLSWDQALNVLDQFEAFCGARGVQGQVTFTGGNPLLYPEFDRVYAEVAARGFYLAILGNPAARARMESILAIAKPSYFQVSLEGLAKHNDEIRGRGHFARTTKFLALLKKLGVYSQVMLTLTRANMDQVIDLGRLLAGKADEFNFNRLSLVGQGASLALPDPADYREFLGRYLDAAHQQPVLRLKDNLLNIVRAERGEELFGGCTGYGCGAAFNFLALLPDGEVHACRKFPSLIGNVFERDLGEIYDSQSAVNYRAGAQACDGCRIRAVCGGCLAISHSLGLDIFAERDPFCFID